LLGFPRFPLNKPAPAILSLPSVTEFEPSQREISGKARSSLHWSKSALIEEKPPEGTPASEDFVPSFWEQLEGGARLGFHLLG
jgi:hypothetical protein